MYNIELLDGFQKELYHAARKRHIGKTFNPLIVVCNFIKDLEHLENPILSTYRNDPRVQRYLNRKIKKFWESMH